MDNNQIDNLLDAELDNAGQQTLLSPTLLQLIERRITPDRQLQPMTFLFTLFGKPCFPRRELVAITGKAKSGKTFVTSMLMVKGLTPKEKCQADSVPCLQRLGEKPLRLLWYDTEQSDESTQDILKNRILPMIARSQGTTEPAAALWQQAGCEVFNVRAVEWKYRRPMLAEAIAHYKPDLVVVDGIRDLVNDINDGVLAQEVMEELMLMATQQDCCIVCVLHENKGAEDHNLRGWIGTELMNKAFEVYASEKLMPQRTFAVEQTLTRKYDIEQTLYFEVDPEGMPVAVSTPAELPANGHKEQLPQLNSQYITYDDSGAWQFDVDRLFREALQGKEEIGGAELRTEVCRLANIAQYKFYNKLLQRALAEKVIVKVRHNQRTFYQAAPF